MWFKNLNLYRLGQFAQDTGTLSQALEAHRFAPCGDLDMQSIGFVPVREGGDLVYAVGRNLFVTLCTEKKILPAAVINEAAKIRAGELEEQQGFKPGRKQMREIKEAVTDELLPRAFSTKAFTRAWLDPLNGWLVIDATSGGRCDDVIKLLLRAVDKFPLESLRVQRSPLAAMTDWLASDEAPAGFTVDSDTELRAGGEGNATVRFIRHTLEVDDVRRHIASGKQCTRLALTWADRVSFVLTESLTLKRIEALDVLKAGGEAPADADERFDGDMLLMCGEFARLFADLVDALGGEVAAGN